MRYIQAFLLLVFLGTVGIFALQNTNAITISMLSWTVTSSVAVLALAIYFLGMITGWTVVAFLRRSIRRISDERTA